MNIGKAVKEMRKMRKMTQAEYASYINISISQLSLIERNIKNPSMNLLKRIASTGGITVSLLFWLATERKDIPQNKLPLYDSIKGSVDSLLKSITNYREIHEINNVNNS